MLRAVAADAEIQRMARRIELVPDLEAALAPAVSDGVADEHEIELPLLGLRQEAFMARDPIGRRRARGRNDGGILGQRRKGEQCGQEQEQCFLHARSMPSPERKIKWAMGEEAAGTNPAGRTEAGFGQTGHQALELRFRRRL